MPRVSRQAATLPGGGARDTLIESNGGLFEVRKLFMGNLYVTFRIPFEKTMDRMGLIVSALTLC